MIDNTVAIRGPGVTSSRQFATCHDLRGFPDKPGWGQLNPLLTLPMEFFTQRHAGDIANRVAANEEIAQLLSNGVAANALNLIALTLIAATMLFYDVLLTAIGIGTLVINVLVLRLVARQRQEINRKLALDRGKLASSTSDRCGPCVRYAYQAKKPQLLLTAGS